MSIIKAAALGFAQEEKGAAMVEYALLVGLIAVASIATLTTLGTTISTMWTTIKGKLTTAIPG